MKKKYKRLLYLLLVLIILFIIMLLIKVFSKDKDSINVLDSLESYNYRLEDRDTELYKENYNLIKKELKNETIDYKKYAEYLCKMFIIDLFTIDNKMSKYDVGGYDFIYSENVENYKLNVSSTIYKNVVNNVDGKRNQKLPVVRSVSISDIKESKFKIGKDKEFESFVLDVSWTYEKALGYDSKATVTMIKQDNKLFVVEYSGGNK